MKERYADLYFQMNDEEPSSGSSMDFTISESSGYDSDEL